MIDICQLPHRSRKAIREGEGEGEGAVRETKRNDTKRYAVQRREAAPAGCLSRCVKEPGTGERQRQSIEFEFEFACRWPSSRLVRVCCYSCRLYLDSATMSARTSQR